MVSKENNSIINKNIKIQKMFKNPLIVAIIVAFISAGASFYVGSLVTDTSQKEKISNLQSDVKDHTSDINILRKETSEHYTKILYSIAELKSNQNHLIKQVDRFSEKYYVQKGKQNIMSEFLSQIVVWLFYYGIVAFKKAIKPVYKIGSGPDKLEEKLKEKLKKDGWIK